VRIDFLLDLDAWGPNITYTQDPVENITWFNPSVIDIEIEEPNLESFSLMHFMFWKTETTWDYFYAVDFQSTSFDPFNPSSSIPYTQDGDNYTVHQEWNATGPGGWLSDGSTSIYLMAYEQWAGMDLLYALRGYYNNDTIIDMGCTAFFDSETGELLMFWPDWWEQPVYAEDDPTATFDPAILCIRFDSADWENRQYDWNVGAGEMDVTGLTFGADEVMPSGDYKTFFSVEDFGYQSNGRITNMTADNDPPVADAGSDWNQPFGDDATLNGSASSDNVGIVSYVWDFEDDGTPVQLVGEVVEYEFTLLGPYDITLTVTDGAGHEDSDTVTMTLVDYVDPVANAGLDVMIPSGTTVTLNGSLSTDNMGIVSYTWTFDDDGPQSLDGVAVEYTFDNADVIVVTLTVEDEAGNSDTDQMTVTVLDITDPVADAGPDQTVAIGTEVTFDGSNSTDDTGVVSWVWTFEDDGDDVTRSGETATYTFENAGTFVVTLEVEDEAGNSDTDTVTIRVSEPPVADAGSPVEVTVGATVTFDGSDSSGDIENYTWTFTYGGVVRTLYGVAPSFTFEIAGNYTVTLTVEDASGLTDTDTVLVTVNEEEDDDETADDKSFLEEYWWLLAALAAVVVVAAAAAAMMMSKKGKGGSPQPPTEEPAEDLPPPPDDMEL
jgi:PKD repeat protein